MSTPEPVYCNAVVFAGNRIDPPEFCDEEAEPGTEYCERHKHYGDEYDPEKEWTDSDQEWYAQERQDGAL